MKAIRSNSLIGVLACVLLAGATQGAESNPEDSQAQPAEASASPAPSALKKPEEPPKTGRPQDELIIPGKPEAPERPQHPLRPDRPEPPDQSFPPGSILGLRAEFQRQLELFLAQRKLLQGELKRAGVEDRIRIREQMNQQQLDFFLLRKEAQQELRERALEMRNELSPQLKDVVEAAKEDAKEDANEARERARERRGRD